MDMSVQTIVSSMQPISLDEMDSVKLLNRTDTKYIFRRNQLPDILSDICNKYSVLYINNTPYQQYRTTYFDTADDKMYIAHQDGKLNRYKIRHRKYLSTGAEFLEIKFKNNKGRTSKKRINFQLLRPLSDADDFIKKYSPFCGEELSPKSLVEYTRLTLVDLVHGERCTIDTDLMVTNCKTGEQADFGHICIIELKRNKCNAVSFMQETLLKHRIFKRGMSKYAIGTAVVYKDIKKNRFKKKILFLEKLSKIEN